MPLGGTVKVSTLTIAPRAGLLCALLVLMGPSVLGGSGQCLSQQEPGDQPQAGAGNGPAASAVSLRIVTLNCWGLWIVAKRRQYRMDGIASWLSKSDAVRPQNGCHTQHFCTCRSFIYCKCLGIGGAFAEQLIMREQLIPRLCGAGHAGRADAFVHVRRTWSYSKRCSFKQTSRVSLRRQPAAACPTADASAAGCLAGSC